MFLTLLNAGILRYHGCFDGALMTTWVHNRSQRARIRLVITAATCRGTMILPKGAETPVETREYRTLYMIKRCNPRKRDQGPACAFKCFMATQKFAVIGFVFTRRSSGGTADAFLLSFWSAKRGVSVSACSGPLIAMAVKEGVSTIARVATTWPKVYSICKTLAIHQDRIPSGATYCEHDRHISQKRSDQCYCSVCRDGNRLAICLGLLVSIIGFIETTFDEVMHETRHAENGELKVEKQRKSCLMKEDGFKKEMEK